MNVTDTERGTALVCDRQGIVQTVLLDELGLRERVPTGTVFIQLVDAASREKARGFLAALQEGRGASDWEMNAPVQSRLMSLTFTGAATPEGFLIVCACSAAGLMRVKSELLHSHPELLGPVHALGRNTGGGVNAEAITLDEFARINNELATLQRQFAKQSAELAVMNEQLRESLANVKELRDLLPICARCKKIRDDQNYWHTVEAYISTHTNARFSHGFCPECLQKELDEIDRVFGPGVSKP